jgi:copper transport protein
MALPFPPRRARGQAPRIALGCLLLAAIVSFPGSSAHASLASSDPAADSTVQTSLRSVELRFTEPVDREYSSAEVADASGYGVATGPVEFDAAAPGTLRVPVRILAEGPYAVTWRALTADGHTVQGSFTFQVGSGAVDPSVLALQRGAGAGWSGAIEAGARAAFYLGLLTAAGTMFYALVIERSAEVPRRLFAAGALAGAVGALGGLAGFLFLSGRLGLGLIEGAQTAAGSVLAGRAALLYAAAGLLGAGVARPAFRQRNVAWVALALAAGAIVATAFGSHAAADPDSRALGIAMDLGHLLVGAVWVGGVFSFVLLRGTRDKAATADAIARFTPWALGSVGLLVLTGAYAGLQRIPRLADLWEQPYGQTLALKVLLVVPLLALGYHHKERALPALRAGRMGVGAFQRTIAGEALLLVGVLVASGVLATSTPADLAAPVFVPAPAPFVDHEATTWTTHVALRLRPNPLVVGPQNLSVILHPLTVKDIPNGTRVTVQAIPQSGAPAQPEARIVLEQRGVFEWTTEGRVFFPRAGAWTVLVNLERPDEQRELSFHVEVGPARR